MQDNFARSLELVLKHEGGYSDHPDDPGKATNLGVTIGTLSDWLGRQATKGEVRGLTVVTVKPIYRQRYWNAIRGDDLPSGVDYCLFDYAVNSGPGRAAMSVQRCVDVADDGAIGPITLDAINRMSPEAVVEDVCAERLNFLRRLSTWSVFGNGWSRRVENVLREALVMAKQSRPPKPTPKPQPAPPLPQEAPRGFWAWLKGLFI